MRYYWVRGETNRMLTAEITAVLQQKILIPWYYRAGGRKRRRTTTTRQPSISEGVA